MALTATTEAEPLARLGDERWLNCPTPEHLLLSILGDIVVVATLRGCRASEVTLAEALRVDITAEPGHAGRPAFALSSFWARPRPRTDPVVERVLTRCLIRARGSGKDLVKSAQVLLSLIDEPDCTAAKLLRTHGVTRYDALNYVSHRIVKGVDASVPPKPASPWVLCGVILHNDDYTPMEFVVHVLETVFDKSRDDAVRLMHSVHESGSAECGVFAYEAALAKVKATTDLGRTHEHALRCVLAIKTTEREGADAELLT